MISRIRKAIAAVTLVSTGVAFFASPMYSAAKLAFSYYDPLSITEFRLNGLSTDQYVEKIEEAIADEDFDDAARIIEIAEEQGHRFDPELVARARESTTARTWRYGKDFAAGFATGDASSPASIVGTMAADYLIVGDLRDIAIEGPKAISGQDYDKLVLGLSLFGVATLVPGTGPIDVGASVVKTAKRAGKLSAGLTNSLGRSARNLIDVGALKRTLSGSSEAMFRLPSLAGMSKILTNASLSDVGKFDFVAFRKATADLVPLDLAAVKRRFTGVLRPTAINEITDFTTTTAAISQKGGVKAAFRSLGKADNPGELKRFGNLAEKTGDRTSSVIRLLGKGAIHLADLIYTIVAALIYAVAWLIGAIWSAMSFFFGVRTIFS